MAAGGASAWLPEQTLANSSRTRPILTLNINGKDTAVDADPSTPILWALRDTLGLTGTKFGCGAAQCGACTVHLGGAATRSCSTPASSPVGQKITTIEAVDTDPEGKAVQQAWVALDVAQCGYCQSGQIMSATTGLRETHHALRHPHRLPGFIH